MKNDSPTPQQASARARQTRSASRQTEAHPEPQLISVERSGDWMPADELRESALAVLSQQSDVTLSLDRIDHLDASALQILLALDSELKARQRHLRLAHASPQLLKWFELAGAGDRFLLAEKSSNE